MEQFVRRNRTEKERNTGCELIGRKPYKQKKKKQTQNQIPNGEVEKWMG